MKIKHLLGLLALLITNFCLLAQPCNNPPSQYNCEDVQAFNAVLCNINDLDGYCTTLPDFPNPTGPSPLCQSNGGGVANNTIWFGFVAGTSTMSLQVIPANCTDAGGGNIGMQLGIYEEPCPPNGQEIVCTGTCVSSPYTLTSSNFEPGKTYYFWIDGCGGSVCDITVDVLAGGPLVMGNINPIQGPKKVCTGGVFTYKVDKVVGGAYYHWTVNGDLQGDPTSEDETIDLTFSTPGVYKICVDVSNFCIPESAPPTPKCIDVTVTDIVAKDPPKAMVCPGAEYSYNNDLYPVGSHDITLTSWQGCDSVVTLEVEEIIVPPKDLGLIYKCFGDCITITDNKGNGGVFCDNGTEEVILQSWQGCDSIVTFELAIVEIDVVIDDPYELGCLVNSTPLDGSQSLAENWTNLNIKWEAFNGGKLSGPSDQLITQTETGGKYCLTLTGTAPGGVSCKDSACVIVTVDPTSPIASIVGDTISCYKDSIILTGSSTSNNSTFAWQGPGGKTYTGANIKIATPGLYTVTTTAPNLCTDSETFNVVSIKSNPNISAAGDTVSCAVPNKTLSGNSSTPGTTFKWYDSSNNVISNTNTVNVSNPGNYVFEVFNPKNGCISKDTVKLAPDFVQPQNVTATGDTFTCVKFPVKVSGNSSTNGVVYSWTGPNGFSSSLQNPDAPFKGLYDLIVTGPNGCKDTVTATVVADTTKPDLATISDTIDCFTFTATVKANTLTNGVTYAWNGPGGTGTNPNFTVSVAGIYNVLITAPNGCTTTGTAEAKDDPDKPVASANVTSPLTCDSLSVTLLGGSSLNLPTITYKWTGPAGFTANTKNAKASAPGLYTLTVTNTKNGCTDDVDITVTQDIATPTVTATGDTTDCVTGQASLTGGSSTPNTTFQWFNSGGVALCPTPNCLVTGAGIYTLVVTNTVNGCTNSATAESVKDDNTPDLTLTKNDDLDCLVKSVDLTATSMVTGLIYSWSGPGVSAGSVNSISTPIPGTFTVNITNPVNLCTNSASIVINQDITKPIISAVTDTIECSNNKTATITGSSDVTTNATIVWVDENAAFVTNNLNFNTTISQNYLLTVTNNTNGCSSTFTLFVPQNTSLPNVSAQGDVINCYEPIAECPGNSTTSNVTYGWSGPGGYTANTPKASNITSPGNYILIVTDKSNGCTSSATAVVTQDNAKPDLTANGGTLTCTNNSQIQLTANSATTPVTWKWTGPNNFNSTLQNPDAFDPGTYTIVVTDTDNGCTEISTVSVISDETAPDLSVNNATIDCINTSQTLTAVSATTGVTYLWTGPSTTSTSSSVVVTLPGNYVCEVTAPNGCKTLKNAVVTLNANLPTAVAKADGEINCTNKLVNVSNAGSSSGPEFVYNWTGPSGFTSNQSNFDVAEPGTYILVITNTSNGCTQTTQVDVPINKDLPTGLVTAEKNPNCFGFSDGFINVTDVIGGTAPFVYAINGKSFSNSSQFQFLSDGTYKISIQDAAGCEYDTLITLEQPQKLVVDAGKDTTINWGEVFTLGIQSVTPSGNIKSLIWTPALDSFCVNCPNPKVQLFDAQLFTVTATDSAGCVATDKKLVLVKKERLVYIANTFSPNGDGNNDFFGIQVGQGIQEVTKFEIYDRWGSKLFKRDNFNPGPNSDSQNSWDGTFRGKKMNSGVFVYWALIKFQDGESILYKGDVTLQR